MDAFSHRNPRAAEFWDERFIRDCKPWDAGGVPEQLRKFVATLAPRTVLIPGCGNAYEAAYLAQAGWAVDAIDFAPAAVSSAQEILGVHAALVREADFFDCTVAANLNAVYERAFFCALPPDMRERIVARWVDILPVGGLLFGYFFLDSNEPAKGPPYAIAPANLHALLQTQFALMQDETVATSQPVFAGRERWQVWRRS